MRRSLLATAFLVALLGLSAGCGSGSGKESAPPTSATTTSASKDAGSSESFDASNWQLLASDPNAHKGASVSFVGRVFTAPERDRKGIYLQVWEDPQNSDNNTVVGYPDSTFQVAEDDYVRFSGTVKGVYSGTNAFGAKVQATLVIADTLKLVDATAAAPPALATFPGVHYAQAGITVTIAKVELAATETRVFVKVRNGSNANVTVYDSSAKAVQAGRQVGPSYSSDYPELASDIVPGASSSGVIVFPKLNPTGDLKLILEANSDNSDVGDYGTLTYTFTWK